MYATTVVVGHLHHCQHLPTRGSGICKLCELHLLYNGRIGDGDWHYRPKKKWILRLLHTYVNSVPAQRTSDTPTNPARPKYQIENMSGCSYRRISLTAFIVSAQADQIIQTYLRRQSLVAASYTAGVQSRLAGTEAISSRAPNKND
jgi:hypothetical protein